MKVFFRSAISVPLFHSMGFILFPVSFVSFSKRLKVLRLILSNGTLDLVYEQSNLMEYFLRGESLFFFTFLNVQYPLSLEGIAELKDRHGEWIRRKGIRICKKKTRRRPFAFNGVCKV